MARKQIHRPGLTLASFSILAILLQSASAQAAEIWLSGLAPSMFSAMHNGETSDYLSLFQPSAPWSRAASAVSVVKIYLQFANSASDAELRMAFADLRRRNIVLAMEAGMMTSTESCGPGEGIGPPGLVTRIAERIRRLGGDLRYVAMDEPLWFGHIVCKTSAAAVARNVSANVAAIKRVFPSVQVGDIEPLGNAQATGWVEQIVQWARAYRDAAGEPLAFFDVDVNWIGSWRHQIPSLAASLHGARIKFGIIYNGNAGDQTGLAWTHHAEERFVAIESGLKLTPDRAILQTWMKQPTHMLPETQSGTMTWLVNRYVAAPTRLVLHLVGGLLEGQLTDIVGRPLVGEPVTLSAETSGDWSAPAVHSRVGLVPPKAAAAVLALRINAECGCSGPADVDIGPMRYRDDRTGQTIERVFRPSAAPGAGAALARFHALPGQPIMQNTPRFPVTAHDPFIIQVPMRTDLTSARSGYVALVFIDAQGKEIVRLRLPLEAAERPIGMRTTDAEGLFSFPPNREVLRQASGFRVEFSGAPQYRIAEASVH